jgi:glycerophosphoryl diester phosphodiesterase
MKMQPGAVEDDATWLRTFPIAHRGLVNGSSDLFENTLEAFTAARNQGAPFEFDVQIALDDVPVVFHDSDFARFGYDLKPVRAMSSSEIRRRRIGPAGLVVPTLDEVLAVVNGATPFVIDVRRWENFGDSRLEDVVREHLSSTTELLRSNHLTQARYCASGGRT